MNMRLIVAMTRAGLMGRDGGMPWHWSEDLKHFRRLTRGHTVLMGRRTWESLGGPLSGRLNVVVSRGRAGDAGPEGEQRDGARWFGSLQAALQWIDAQDGPGDLFVLGGAQIFDRVLSAAPLPGQLVVTWVPDVETRAGDTIFPRTRDWIEQHYDVADERAGETGELRFVTYERKRGGSCG